MKLIPLQLSNYKVPKTTENQSMFPEGLIPNGPSRENILDMEFNTMDEEKKRFLDPRTWKPKGTGSVTRVRTSPK
jgi:hypothetical protein